MNNIKMANQPTAALGSHHQKPETRNCKRRSRRVASALCLVAAALALSSAVARAQQSGTWTADSDGNWSDTTKWSGGLVATGATYSAIFNFDIGANHTVTLDTPVTIGTVIVGDTGGNSLWTLSTANGSVLTLDNGLNIPMIRAVQAGTGFRCDVVIAGTNGFQGPDTQDGVLALGATNTYTGDTVISRNILKINADGAIPSGAGYGNVVMTATNKNPGNTAKLDLNTFSPTINGLNSVFDPVAYPDFPNPPLVYSAAGSGSTVTLTVGAGNANGEFGGIIQNGTGRSLALTKIGTGTQSLTNVNVYSGPTTISAGTLKYAVAGSSGNSPITVAATGTLKIQQAAADTTWTSYSGTFNSGALVIDLGSNPISSSVPPVTFSFGVIISATPTISITGPTIPNGTYPLIYYTTAVTGVGLLPDSVSLPGGGFGTLQDNIGTQTIDLVVGGALPPNIHWATGNGTWDTSTFNWKNAVGGSTNYFPGVPVQFKDVDATGNPIVTLNSSVQPAFVLVNATKNYTLTGSGSIDGSASLTKVGSGAVTLDLTSGFTGGAAISQGTVNVKKAAAFGNVSGMLTMLGGALDNTSTGPLTLLDYPQAWDGDFAFVGTHDLDMGSGSVTLNAARTVTVNASTLRVGGSFSFGTSQYNFAKAGAGTLRLDGAIGTRIGNVTVNAGTLILGGTNTYVGDTRSVAGNLIVAGSLALGKSRLNLLNTDTGTWSFSTLTNVILGSLKGNRPLGLTNASGAAVELRVGNNNGYTSGDSYFGTMSGSGSLTKVGSGTWQMGGAGGQGSGTYSGDTTVVAGTLQIGKSDVFPHGAGKGNFIIQSGGTFDFLDRTTLTFNGLFGDGTFTSSDIGGLGSPNQTLTVGDGNANGSFGGVIHEWPKGGKIAGKISLVKIGTGTQVLGGVSSYSRDTIVNGGTLQVDGTLYDTNDIPATVTVNANATLAGSGTIKGPVVVNSGGTIGAGASAGTLILANGLDLSAGGTDAWELAALEDDSNGTGGIAFDVISVTGGTLTLGGSSTLKLLFTGTATVPNGTDPFWQTTHRWTIISAGGAASDFAAIQNGAYGAGTFATSVEAGGIVLTFTPGMNMSIATGPGSNLTLSYRGGTGSQFVLLQTNNVAAPLNLWKRTQTNTSPTGSFVIAPGPGPQQFYRVKSE